MDQVGNGAEGIKLRKELEDVGTLVNRHDLNACVKGNDDLKHRSRDDAETQNGKITQRHAHEKTVHTVKEAEEAALRILFQLVTDPCAEDLGHQNTQAKADDTGDRLDSLQALG